MSYRKPVVAFQDHLGGDDNHQSYMTVLCDDGAVFSRRADDMGAPWIEETPVPGTFRAHVKELEAAKKAEEAKE